MGNNPTTARPATIATILRGAGLQLAYDNRVQNGYRVRKNYKDDTTIRYIPMTSELKRNPNAVHSALESATEVLQSRGYGVQLTTTAEQWGGKDIYLVVTPATAEDTCGNCRGSLTEDDWCGYGGHDLNQLFKEQLPENERFRCCDCLSIFAGACCCCD